MIHRFVATTVDGQVTEDCKSFDECRAAVIRSLTAGQDCVMWRKSYRGLYPIEANLYDTVVAAIRTGSCWTLMPCISEPEWAGS